MNEEEFAAIKENVNRGMNLVREFVDVNNPLKETEDLLYYTTYFLDMTQHSEPEVSVTFIQLALEAAYLLGKASAEAN